MSLKESKYAVSLTLFLAFTSAFGTVGCGKKEESQPTEQKTPFKSLLPVQRTDLPEITDLNQLISENEAIYQIVEMQSFTHFKTTTDDYFLIQLKIDGHARNLDHSLRLPHVGYPITLSAQINTVTHGKYYYGTFFPDQIRKNSDGTYSYDQLIRIESPRFHTDSNKQREGFVTYNYIQSGPIKTARPNDVLNLMSLSSHHQIEESRIYRLSNTEFEVRSLAIPYDNVDIYSVAKYRKVR